MRITVAKTAGFCFGVDRAINMVHRLLDEGKKVCTLGPIIHNPQMVAELTSRGVRIVERVDEVNPDETVVIRSHGVPRGVYEQIEGRVLRFSDATCPFVAKIHKIVAEKSAQGYFVLIAGNPDHPETLGIRGHCSGPSEVVDSPEALALLVKNDKKISSIPVILIAQTTFNLKIWEKCVDQAKKLYTNLLIFDTICSATGERQKEAMELARRCDLMVVIGGKESSNTQKLRQVCESSCRTILIETAAELRKAALSGCRLVGVTAGASTPSAIIEEVLQTMSEIERTNIENEEINFAEALEESLKTVYTGEKVTGYVTAITPTEVQVEIGTKHMGFIPLSELTADPTAKAEDIVKAGDEIELLVMRVNDVEGTVTLSKKQLDTIKGREIVSQAYENGDVLEGVVTDIIKGGVLVVSHGVSVFVPASQATLSRNDDLEALKGQKVQFKIIEMSEKRRRRAVGSIKQVLIDARKDAEEKIWSDIEAGKIYTGTVKSLTSYGAFVDIGGVDGMIHISELSWNRIKHPSEVVSVGDTVEVYIKDLNPETKKISLGYKKTDENPWVVIQQKISLGSVVEAKVVSMTPFGAFVQIVPGIDGLIHISQISTERIEKPSDILEIGQGVTAKITEFDPERKRISLSIRALIEEKEAAEHPAMPQVDDVAEDAPAFYASTDDLDALKGMTGKE